MMRLALPAVGIAISSFALGQKELFAFDFNGNRSKINFMTGEITPFGTTENRPGESPRRQ